MIAWRLKDVESQWAGGVARELQSPLVNPAVGHFSKMTQKGSNLFTLCHYVLANCPSQGARTIFKKWSAPVLLLLPQSFVAELWTASIWKCCADWWHVKPNYAKLKSSEISVYSDTNQLARPLLFMIQRNKRNGPNSSSLKLQCVRSKSGQEQRQSQCLGPQMGWTNIESICDEEHIWSWESEFLRIEASSFIF